MNLTSLGRLTPLALFALAAYACGGTDNALIGDGGPDGNAGPDASQDASSDNNVVPDSGLSCTAPMANCSGNPADGCNVDLSKDDANCGGCGVVCNTQCTGGVCPLVPADAGTPQNVGDFACLTVDANNVYWGTGLAANSGGGVWKVPVNGGNATLIVGQQDRPHSLASDGTNLYYTNFGAVAGTGSVQRVAINGTVPTALAIGQASPLDIAIDTTSVYWTNTGDGSIWKADKNASVPSPVNVVPAAGANHARFLRLDASNIYFTDAAGGKIYRVAKTGGTPAPMTSVPNAGHLAIDTTSAYVGSSSTTGAAILSVALSATNGNSQQIMPNLKTVAGIDTDGTDVWYAVPSNVLPWQGGTGEIHRMTIAGQNDQTLAKAQNAPGCIAIDAKSVYWINEGSGMISKTAK